MPYYDLDHQLADQFSLLKVAPFLTLPVGWDAAWRAAKGSGSGLVTFLGDSIWSGNNSGNWQSLSAPALIEAALVNNGTVTLGGEFYCAEGFTPGAPQNYTPGTSPYATFGGAGYTREWAFGRCLVSNPNGTQTFTCPFNAVGFDIVYHDWASATPGFTFTIDGGQGGSPTVTGATWNGSAWAVNTVGSGSDTAAVTKRVRVTGLAAGQHVIVLTSSASANTLNLSGITAYTQAPGTGFVFARHCHSGIAACDLMTPAGAATGVQSGHSSPADKLGLHGAQTTGLNFTGAPAQPNLALIELGVNDCDYGYSVRAYELAMTKAIMALRAGVPNCSIMLVAPSVPNNWYSDDTGTATTIGQRWPQFKASMRRLSHTYQCAFVDIDSKWGEQGHALGFQATNDLHPLAAGHADIANLISGVL